MGRYKRKTNRQSWNKEDMRIAINEVRQNNKSVNSVANAYNLPEPTLRRYLKRDPEKVRLKSLLK